MSVFLRISVDDDARLDSLPDDIITPVMAEIGAELPGEIQSQMASSVPGGKPFPGGGRRSASGQPPAIVTRSLFNSIRAKAERRSVILSMAGHGFYLDPNFKGAGKGGGRLNRPFIDKPLDSVVEKLKPL